ncbi:MAG: putative quinol monooxygenase [Acidimicrobiia bacterium]
MEFNCKEGLGPDVLKAMLAALPDTRSYDGAELIEAYVDEDNPDCIMVWEKWAGRVNQESYVNWRTETGMLAQFEAVLASPPRFVHLGQEKK